MKKLSITLLMLLCMAISMFALASCGDPEPENGDGDDEVCEHVWASEATVDKAATCTTAGSKSIKCTKCAEKKSVQAIPASHSWAEAATVDKASTCTEAGEKSVKCTACGAKDENTVEALPLAAHAWASEATVDKASTCTEAGEKSIKCTACGAKDENTVEALPLAAHEWDTIPTIDFEPTCEHEGQMSIKCVDCYTIKQGSIVPIDTIEHDWADVATQDKAPTCNEEGVKTVKCKECGAKKAGSEEPIPAEHTWGFILTEDNPPLCFTDGSKSIKCDVCGEKKPGSDVAIPATHTIDDGTVLVLPSLFSNGEKYGTCVVCGNEGVVAKIDTLSPSVSVIDSSFAGTFVQKWNFGSNILKNGQNHFYPTDSDPDGKSLFVEFSFLWNDSLKNNIFEQYVGFVRIANSGGSEANGMWWLNFDDNIEDHTNHYAGGFEASAGTVISGYDCMTEGGSKESYPNIGEYGWHRIGIQVRQTVEVVDGEVKYKMFTALYIDGVMACEYQLDEDNINPKNYLYTAELVDGKLQYKDIGSERYLYIYRIGESGTRGNNKAYFVMGELSVRCADELEQDVEPVTNPEDAVLAVEPGVVLPAKVYYKLKSPLAQECTDHIDRNDDGKCDIPNCGVAFFDGCDTIPCLDTNKDGVCNNANCSKNTGNRPIPTVCEHDDLYYELTTVATMFAPGQKTAYCPVCGEYFYQDINTNTTCSIIRMTASSTGTYVVKRNIKSDVLGSGNHFYPTKDNPEGNDLFMEFSFLWNETLKNSSEGYMALGAPSNKDGGNAVRPFQLSFIDNHPNQWCKEAGGIEACDGAVYISGADCTKENGTYPNIGEYGWHRIGIQIHQDAAIVDGAVKYTVIASLYIDGVMVSCIDISNHENMEANLLYTARIVAGNLVYTDNPDTTRHAFAYRLGSKSTKQDEMYFGDGDIYITAGKNFVVPVEPAEKIKSATITVADGVDLPATVYYQVVGIDLSCRNHVDADDNGICDNEDCDKAFYDGCDLVDCLDTDKDGICNNDNCSKETTNRPIPTVCEHDELIYETTTVATMFAPGKKSAHCPVCDEYFYQEIDSRTDADVRKMTSSDTGTYVTKKTISTQVLNGAHFYPTKDNPEGNDLFMEFSFLWNETLAKNVDGEMGVGAPSRKDGGNAVRPFYLHFADNIGSKNKVAGGFEACAGAVYVSGADCTKENGSYPNLGDYGWHRIGIQIHQEAAIVDGAVKYTVIASLYIDGVNVCTVDISDVENMEANLLYTAKIVDGELVYADNSDTGRTAFAYRLANKGTISGVMCFADGDIYITAGKDFVVPVEPVENPRSATLDFNGGKLPASVYYKVSGIDVVCNDHVDADDNGVCDYEDCDAVFFDGCDIVDCLDTDNDGICNNDNCSKETTNRPAPTECDHDNLVYETTIVATMFAPGQKSAYCVVCEEYFYEGIDSRTSVDVRKFTTSDSGTYVVKKRISSDVLKGDHFYPTKDNPEGNDLFMEFSFLWNETLANNKDGYMGVGAPSNSGGGNAVRPFYLYFIDNGGDYCQTAGGFEACTGAVYVSGANCTETGNTFPNLGDYGWHRIGVQIHQDAEIVDGAVKYTVLASLYIDGVKVTTVDISNVDNMEDNLLYTAEIVNGTLVYSDNSDTSRHAFIYRLGNKNTTSGEMYFADGDEYASAGKDFVVPVEPVENPKSATLEVASGVNLPASVYYKVSGLVCLNHVDANDDGECDNDGCEKIYFDGCDTIACYDSDGDGICDNDGCTKETSNGPAPTVCDHVNLAYEVSKVPTMFSVGEKSAYCPVCGETFTESYGSLTSADIREFTSSDSGTYVIKKNIKSSVLNGAHFYPTEDNPEGNDLFVEFSFLWNETLANNTNGVLTVGSPCASGGNDAVHPFQLALKDKHPSQWCQEAGGFETCNDAVIVSGNYECNKGNGSYPNLGEYGWHRIGVQIHQDTEIVDGAVKYTVIASLYIDGVMVSCIDISNHENMEANLLYTAKIVNGKLVYSDNSDTGRTAYVYRLANKGTTGDDMYFGDGDAYVTAGKSFVVEVEPVKNPEASTITVADGVNLSAAVYYTVK